MRRLLAHSLLVCLRYTGSGDNDASDPMHCAYHSLQPNLRNSWEVHNNSVLTHVYVYFSSDRRMRWPYKSITIQAVFELGLRTDRVATFFEITCLQPYKRDNNAQRHSLRYIDCIICSSPLLKRSEEISHNKNCLNYEQRVF